MTSIRKIFFDIMDYKGDSLCQDVLTCWQDIPIYRGYLKQIEQQINAPDDALYITDDADWELYALSRVLDILTCSLHPDSRYPKISLTQYIQFAQSIGLTIEQPTQFHPFYYEIVDIQDDESPFSLCSVNYPALFLGNLLINRGGAVITLPATEYAIKQIPQSALYWAYTRNNREAHDLSHGWGNNSQWRTSFRFDFKTEKGFYYNFKGRDNLNQPEQKLLLELHQDGLSLNDGIELVRYRQRLNGQESKDLFPYDYRFFEVYN